MADENQLTKKQRAFLAAYTEVGNVTDAAKAANVARCMHYEWLEQPDYAAAFRKAEQQAADNLEKEAIRRAVEGVRRIKFGRNGQPLINPETGEPYAEHEYSDTLLIFLLKGLRPDKYRENVRQEISGPDGEPLTIQIDGGFQVPGVPKAPGVEK